MNSKGVLCILVFFVHLYCIAGMVYESIQWSPDNPIFTFDENSNCDPAYKYRLLKIQSASKIKFICPNVATVLKSTSNEVSKTNKYENLWFLKNRTSFDDCDTNLDPDRRLLLRCDTPTQLVFYSVTFQRHSAEPEKELTFKRGQSYFFVATSNRLLSHINDTRDGHCNDAANKVYMRIEVYVCNTSDPTCDTGVGKLECPRTLPPTASSSTTSSSTTPTQPVPTPTQPTTTPTQPTPTPTQPTPSSKASVGQTVTTGTVLVTEIPTREESGILGKRTGDGENEEAKKATRWMAVAIFFVVLCFVIVIAILVKYFCGKKKCQAYQAKVEQSPEYGRKNLGFKNEVDGKEPKTSITITEHEYDVADKDANFTENEYDDIADKDANFTENEYDDIADKDANFVITNGCEKVIFYQNTAVVEGEESKENPPI